MGIVSQKEVLKYCVHHHIPFAISKLPDSTENKLVVSKYVREVEIDQFFRDHNNDGFMIAPFSFSKEKAQWLNADFEIGERVKCFDLNELNLDESQPEKESNEVYYADYASYKEQFDGMFQAIKNGDVSKVILSRIKPIKEFSKELAADFYYTLSESYPKAYVFMFFTPQSGMWAGASPELLFNVENQEATTVSLAGTQKWSNNACNINWDKKERDEQQIVSDYINEILDRYHVNNIQVEGPETIKAGKVSHLKTQYKFSVLSNKWQLGSLICDIHPTPAVCGLPKNESMNLIQTTEKHQRSYYAGFLGRIKNEDINLFVNIRSMKFTNGGVDLYLGGGITAGSDPGKEWKETEMKAETLLSVIEKVKLVHQQHSK